MTSVRTFDPDLNHLANPAGMPLLTRHDDHEGPLIRPQRLTVAAIRE